MDAKFSKKFIYLLSRLIALSNNIIRHYDEFEAHQIEVLKIYASHVDVYTVHIRSEYMPKRYNPETFETLITDYEDKVVKYLQWHDLKWKKQKPLD